MAGTGHGEHTGHEHDADDGHVHDENCSHGHDGHGNGHSHGHGPVSSGQGLRLPVIVLTGYLGAGKTTLLNYILTEQKDQKLAVIENEIGEISIDDSLVEQKHSNLAEELVTLSNGCVCCTLRGDLMKTLQDISKMVKDGKKLDGVLIELTGAADPAPVVQTFFLNGQIRDNFYVDNVVALVDAKHGLERLDEGKASPDKATPCAQVAFSSTVLLNKIDLATPDEILKVEKRLKEINSTVKIMRCENAKVPIAELFKIGCFNLEKVLEEQYMDEDEFEQFYTPKMDNSISNVGLRIEGPLMLSWVQQALGVCLGGPDAADFLRIKGVLNIEGCDLKYVIQCVQMAVKQDFTVPWAEGETRESKIIFIGRNMTDRRDFLTDGFTSCQAKPLRFRPGSMVLARTGPNPEDYTPGLIIGHHPDQHNAYAIRLKSGRTVHAPRDTEALVKADPNAEPMEESGCSMERAMTFLAKKAPEPAAESKSESKGEAAQEHMALGSREWLASKGLGEFLPEIMTVCTMEYLKSLEASKESEFVKSVGLTTSAAKKFKVAMAELRLRLAMDEPEDESYKEV